MNKIKRCKVCITTKQKLFLKGERCFSKNCSFDKKNSKNKNTKQYQNKKIKTTVLQRISIKKIKNIFGITELYLKTMVKKYNQTFLHVLEYKIDRFLTQIGVFDTILQARQYIIFKRQIFIEKQNKFVRCKRNSLILKKGDKIKIFFKTKENKIKKDDKINKINAKGIKIINLKNNSILIEIEDYSPESIEKFFFIRLDLLLRYYNYKF